MNTTKWMRGTVFALSLGLMLVAGNARAANVTWSGGVNNAWDIGGTANWTGDATTYADGCNVGFGDAGNNTTINLTTALSPATKTFSNTTA